MEGGGGDRDRTDNSDRFDSSTATPRDKGGQSNCYDEPEEERKVRLAGADKLAKEKKLIYILLGTMDTQKIDNPEVFLAGSKKLMANKNYQSSKGLINLHSKRRAGLQFNSNFEEGETYCTYCGFDVYKKFWHPKSEFLRSAAHRILCAA